MNWKAWGVLGCECIGPRRQGSWLAWNSNRGHEDECMHVFLLEAEKAKLDNGSNEGIQGKKRSRAIPKFTAWHNVWIL